MREGVPCVGTVQVLAGQDWFGITCLFPSQASESGPGSRAGDNYYRVRLRSNHPTSKYAPC